MNETKTILISRLFWWMGGCLTIILFRKMWSHSAFMWGAITGAFFVIIVMALLHDLMFHVKLFVLKPQQRKKFLESIEVKK